MLPVALKCLHDSCHKHFFLQGSGLHLPVLQDAGSSLRMDLHMGISANCLGNGKARKENWFLFLLHAGSQLHATVFDRLPSPGTEDSLLYFAGKKCK